MKTLQKIPQTIEKYSKWLPIFL